MRKLKGVITVLVLFLAVNLNGVYVNANDNDSANEVIFYVNENGEAEFVSEIKTINLLTRGLYYYSGTARIQNTTTSGKILISGNTEANYAINKVMLSLTLEKYSNGSWVYVTSKYYEKTNTDYVSGEEYCNVTKGNTYRVSAVFTVQHNGVTETQTGSSAGIIAY